MTAPSQEADELGSECRLRGTPVQRRADQKLLQSFRTRNEQQANRNTAGKSQTAVRPPQMPPMHTAREFSSHSSRHLRPYGPHLQGCALTGVPLRPSAGAAIRADQRASAGRRRGSTTDGRDRLPDRALSISQAHGWARRASLSGTRLFSISAKNTSFAGTKRNLSTLPIRFLPTPPRCRVLPGTGVKLRIGRCGNAARDAEQ